MIKKVGTLGEVCDATNAVANTYLDEGNEKQYREWHVIADVECMSAKLEGRDAPAQLEIRQKQSEDAAKALVADMDNAAIEGVDGN